MEGSFKRIKIQQHYTNTENISDHLYTSKENITNSLRFPLKIINMKIFQEL